MSKPGPSNLPGRPATSHCPSLNATTTVTEAHTSATSITCSVCSNSSKYTCPRCSVKTCSLACSKYHKTSTGCTGERNRAAYVPMNTYTWGSLADDYTFLEDVGRNAASWGRDIVSTGRGGGGARGKRAGGRVALKPKCEELRVQLAARDVEINFVSEGMEKRRLNQSLWDVRIKTIYLTIEFVFHLEDVEGKDGKPSSATLLTHRNDLAAPLFASLVSHLKRKSDVPNRVLDMMGVSRDQTRETPVAPPESLFTISQLEKASSIQPAPAQYQAPALPIRIMSQNATATTLSHQATLKPQKVFYAMDANSSLRNCLRYRSFIEWPTIDIFPSRRLFHEQQLGVLAENHNSSVRPMSDERGSNKRRKTETGLVQLVGGYEEESEPEPEPERSVPTRNEVIGIGMLGGYASDDEQADNFDDEIGETLEAQRS